MYAGVGEGTVTDVSHRHLLFCAHVFALLSAEQLSQSSGPPHEGSIDAAGSENTVYSLSVPPPLDAGATHLTVTSLSPLTPYTPVGAPGTVPGTNASLYSLHEDTAYATSGFPSSVQMFDAVTLK